MSIRKARQIVVLGNRIGLKVRSVVTSSAIERVPPRTMVASGTEIWRLFAAILMTFFGRQLVAILMELDSREKVVKDIFSGSNLISLTVLLSS